jgi:hypothetical protein
MNKNIAVGLPRIPPRVDRRQVPPALPLLGVIRERLPARRGRKKPDVRTSCPSFGYEIEFGVKSL